MNCFPNDDDLLSAIERIQRNYKLETWARRLAAFVMAGGFALIIGYMVAAYLRGAFNL